MPQSIRELQRSVRQTSVLRIKRERPQKVHLQKAAAPARSSFQVSRKLLLGIYSIIPIAFAIAVIDSLFFHSSLKAILPYSPNKILLFSVFFNLPHILASSITFCDREYIRSYGLKIVLPFTLVGAAFLAFPSMAVQPVFLGIFYLWTIVHVIGQQFGMSRMMGGSFGKSLDVWKWTAIGIGAFVYLGTYVKPQDIGLTESSLRLITLTGAWALAIPFAALAAQVYRRAGSFLAKNYTLANAAMIISVLTLYAMKYPFFVILIPRVIHDISAFLFYDAHDRNRNHTIVRNGLYRVFRSIGIPMSFLTPWLAIAIAFPFTYYSFRTGHSQWVFNLGIFMSLFHYYTDHFTWKKGSPHRASISVR